MNKLLVIGIPFLNPATEAGGTMMQLFDLFLEEGFIRLMKINAKVSKGEVVSI